MPFCPEVGYELTTSMTVLAIDPLLLRGGGVQRVRMQFLEPLAHGSKAKAAKASLRPDKALPDAGDAEAVVHVRAAASKRDIIFIMKAVDSVDCGVLESLGCVDDGRERPILA